MAAVYVVTAAAEQGGLHGLITVRIIFKPRPCAELAGMINADLVPISHVSSSHQLARVLHVVITVAVVGRHVDAAVQRALLERDQLIDVMALTERGGRTVHVLARSSRGMHAEAVVQARERRPYEWPWTASCEASPRAHTASHLDVNHESSRPTREYPWLVCFEYDT